MCEGIEGETSHSLLTWPTAKIDGNLDRLVLGAITNKQTNKHFKVADQTIKTSMVLQDIRVKNLVEEPKSFFLFPKQN